MSDHDLRVLILTKVIGAKRASGTLVDHWYDFPSGNHACWDDGETPWANDPLTDMNAAMEALQTFVEREGVDWGTLEFGQDDGKMFWNVMIGPNDCVSDPSLPRAICLALAEAVKS